MQNFQLKKLPHKSHYYSKVMKSALLAIAIITGSLIVGIAGYSYFFNLGFTDSLLNASMILTGMGPVDKAETNSAKIFASVYAIYSGVAFLTSVAVLFSPVFQRFLHRFHLDVRE
jgi:hypothetical protein